MNSPTSLKELFAELDQLAELRRCKKQGYDKLSLEDLQIMLEYCLMALEQRDAEIDQLSERIPDRMTLKIR